MDITIDVSDKMRLSLIDSVLDFMRKSDDPRAPKAIYQYEKQRKKMLGRMQPPAQTVSMKSANLGVKTNG